MRRSLALLTLALGCAAPPSPRPAAPAAVAPHPLDPLRADELVAATAVLKASGHLPEGALLPLLALDEPPKAEVLAFRPGDPFRRQARAVVLDRLAGRAGEALIDLAGRRLLGWRDLPGVQPALTAEEMDAVPAVVRADPRWRDALRRRGIEDPAEVHLDVWAPGPTDEVAPPAGTVLAGAAAHGPRRLARAVAFWRGAATNPYGRPVEGLLALVDLGAMEVVAVEDHGVVPVTRAAHDLDVPARRPAPRPLVTTQPEGASFTLRGQEVAWQGWRLRWTLHPREGLVLHQVGFEDEGRLRPVLYRASLSEIVVPYADPAPAWAWRQAFDEGEYGLGRSATRQARGADVPAHATLLDAVLADDRGAPAVLEEVVAIYERDGGLLWRHLDEETGRLDARRARELVLRITITIGNYDYAFAWVLGQDGALALEVGLTGLLLAKGVSPTTCGYCPDLAAGRSPAPEPPETRYGTLVAPGVLAPNHQHVFCARLDLDVDGPRNSVLEVNAAPATDDPRGTAFVVERTLLASERAARRDVDPARARRWTVFNPDAPTALGHLPGYTLVPGDNAAFLPGPAAGVRRRAAFAGHDLWVTRHEDGERFAAGDHPSQAADPGGLPRYVEDDAPLVGEDVVLWYSFGVTHGPRVEEWPVMTVHRTGFRLVPHGFFARNPALEVPP
ncbi:MAG: primary-amine oxidase [Planctomycetes bacterium]|nr:primary-amine oxidase [Planctomycetota bacterium]